MLTKVLVVDDSPSMRLAVSEMLRGMQMEPVQAESGEQAIELYMQEHPGIILLDVNMPGIDGYETAQRIRASSPNNWVPIIFLSANESDQDFTKAIESGGDDYLVKPVGRIVLAAKIRALQRLDEMRRKLTELSNELTASNRRLEQISHSDGLTGVANRRFFDSFIAQHVALAARQKTNLSLALCDVDYFKKYNDHYGHLSGDECLRRVAQVLSGSCIRATDLVARYGGEEFALVLPDTHRTGAAQHIRNVRQALANAAIEHKGSDISPFVTLSIGITAFTPGKDTKAEDLIARADEALYRAKEAGRNRYIVV